MATAETPASLRRRAAALREQAAALDARAASLAAEQAAERREAEAARREAEREAARQAARQNRLDQSAQGLTAPELAQHFGVVETTMGDWTRLPRFPAPVGKRYDPAKPGNPPRVWDPEQVQDWLVTRATDKDQFRRKREAKAAEMAQRRAQSAAGLTISELAERYHLSYKTMAIRTRQAGFPAPVGERVVESARGNPPRVWDPEQVDRYMTRRSEDGRNG